LAALPFSLRGVFCFPHVRLQISPPIAQPHYWTRVSSSSRLHDHTQIHYTRYDSSGRMISPTQRHLPDNTQHSQETDFYVAGGIRTCNPSKRVGADPHLRPRGHWYLHFTKNHDSILKYVIIIIFNLDS
jgi:hypothetical protein